MNMNTYPYICYKVSPILSFINDNAHYSKNKPKKNTKKKATNCLKFYQLKRISINFW